MKKFLALLLVLCMMLPMVALAEDAHEVKLSQVLYAAHGAKCFAVITVAMEGDKIVAAHIEEFQFMANTSIGVPNSDADFGKNFPEGQVLASKRVNNEAYSNNMKRVGSTVALLDNYTAIEAFATGKTISELEKAMEGKDEIDMVDAVTGATLVDTWNYLQGILAAAKAAQ